MASPPGPLSNREGERVPLAFPDKNAKGEVTPSLLERGPGGEAINLRVLCRLLSIPPTPKGENIADKVENRVSFPAVFSPLGVKGRAINLRVLCRLLSIPPTPKGEHCG